MSIEKYSKHCPEDFQKEAYEELIKKVLISKNCLKCNWELKQIWRWKFSCIECNSKFSIKAEPSLFKDLSNPKNWKANCTECNGIMDFNESNFTYYCKCWAILEV